MRIALLSCALIGCAYQPGSFAHTPKGFAGQRVTIGCLDVAVDRRADLAIGPAIGPVLDYRFANRCDHATMVDLGAVAVVGRNADGSDLPLRPYDPQAELHPVALDGRNAGGEALAYPADREILEVCVDAASLAHADAPRWLCFGNPVHPVVGRLP
jgi:hypothetical protein